MMSWLTPPAQAVLWYSPFVHAMEMMRDGIFGSRVDAEYGFFVPTAACLVLERRTWRGADKITHVRLIFPGEAYDLVARFAPSKDGAQASEREAG